MDPVFLRTGLKREEGEPIFKAKAALLPLGERLKRYREFYGKSIDDLAQESGVNRLWIYKVESGRTDGMAHPDRWPKLAEALNGDAFELVWGRPAGMSLASLPSGERIRRLRIARGWSYRQFEEATGLTYALVRGLEKGTYLPDAGMRNKIARQLEVKIVDLFGLSEKEFYTLPPGGRIKNLRILLGVSPLEMARACGVTLQMVQVWERGDGVPEIATRPVLANFLKVTPGQLFDPSVDQFRLIRIGLRIQIIRGNRGISQRMLAEQLKIPPTTLARWEDGRAVPPQFRRRQLAAFFKKPPIVFGISDSDWEVKDEPVRHDKRVPHLESTPDLIDDMAPHQHRHRAFLELAEEVYSLRKMFQEVPDLRWNPHQRLVLGFFDTLDSIPDTFDKTLGLSQRFSWFVLNSMRDKLLLYIENGSEKPMEGKLARARPVRMLFLNPKLESALETIGVELIYQLQEWVLDDLFARLTSLLPKVTSLEIREDLVSGLAIYNLTLSNTPKKSKIHLASGPCISIPFRLINVSS